MQTQLTQKERSLLEDQKSHEEVCIQKYTSYAEQAHDPDLKRLFSQYASQEQEHYNTVNQFLQGQQAPQAGQQAGASPQSSGQNRGARFGNSAEAGDDAVLCNDMLMTEKYVSGTYDTAVFEASNSDLRQALQHIQREEQQHGEGIFNYMQKNGMYHVK